MWRFRCVPISCCFESHATLLRKSRMHPWTCISSEATNLTLQINLATAHLLMPRSSIVFIAVHRSSTSATEMLKHRVDVSSIPVAFTTSSNSSASRQLAGEGPAGQDALGAAVTKQRSKMRQKHHDTEPVNNAKAAEHISAGNRAKRGKKRSREAAASPPAALRQQAAAADGKRSKKASRRGARRVKRRGAWKRRLEQQRGEQRGGGDAATVPYRVLQNHLSLSDTTQSACEVRMPCETR